MKISIIVPVYNIEEYIGDCVQSIIRQDYPNLEVIFVDDRGEDKSMHILQQFLSTYSGNKEFRIHKMPRNMGLSEARNAGLKEATGKYVLFIDGDDYLFPDAVTNLVKTVQKDPSIDFVYGQITQLLNDNLLPWGRPLPTGVSQHPISHLIAQNIHLVACNKLILKSVLIENNIYFEQGILHEDGPWTFELCLKSKRCACIDENTYVYRQRAGSINSCTTTKNVDGYSKGILKMYSLISGTHPINPQILCYVRRLSGIVFLQISEIKDISISTRISMFHKYHALLHNLTLSQPEVRPSGFYHKLLTWLIYGTPNNLKAFCFFSILRIKKLLMH